MISRRFAAMGLALALAGCVTASPHPFSAAEVETWKLAGVEAVIPQDGRLIWPKVADEYLDKTLPRGPSKTVSDESGREQVILGDRPPITDEIRRGARTYVEAKFAERVRYYAEPLRATLKGQRPVKIVTTVHDLDVPSAARQVVVGLALAVIGGAVAASQAPRSTLSLTTEVVDAKTGAVLATYPKRTLSRGGGEAILFVDGSDRYAGDAVAGMLRDYEADFNAWLLAKAQ